MQVNFLSERLCAKGKTLDRRYLQHRREDKRWPTIKFPTEKPPNKDFTLWKEALYKVAPGGRIADRLGGLVHDGRKIWEWRYVESEHQLRHLHGGGMDIYSHSTQRQYTNLANRYEKVETVDVQEEGGDICTTKEVANGIVCIVSHSPPAPQQTKPSSWLEVLREWGCTWMWSLFGW